MKHQQLVAPEISVCQWFNTSGPITLAAMRGRPVLIHAFQMLCPGCVSHAIPQTQKAYEMFSNTDLAVIGLHTVFEHHDAMSPVALEAFIHEYGLTFPIGIDEPGASDAMPATMARYEMRGTPTTLLIGRDGRLSAQTFGQIDDMALGALIQSVMIPVSERANIKGESEATKNNGRCSENACSHETR